MVTLEISEIWDLLNSIPDPEVPAISIVELGVVRDVRITGSNVDVDITPTYSGCPALKSMEEQIRANPYPSPHLLIL